MEDIRDFLSATMKNLVGSCGIERSDLTSSYKNFILNIVFIIFGYRICHLFLHPLGQPRIISEFIVGLLVANIPFLNVQGPVLEAFKVLEIIASSTYMFVLGLEMEPLSILKPPGPEASIAYTGIVSTVALSLITIMPFYSRSFKKNIEGRKPRVVAIFAVMFAATSSPIVTRLTTELKLSKSEIGRRAIRASIANDMLCTILVCFLFAFRGSQGDATGMEIMKNFICVAIEMAVIVVVVRPIFRWVNNQNPEGEPMNGMHLFATITLALLLCHASFLLRYEVKVNSFLIGLALPREGRVSNFLISKINYILTTFILPLYFPMANLKMTSSLQHGGGKERVTTSWSKLILVVGVATAGKLLGTLAAGWYYGLHWLEAITLGVLLNIKGYLHVFFTIHSRNQNYMDEDSVMVLMCAVMIPTVITSPLVSFIVKHVRLQGGTPRLMGLQWHNLSSELRMVVGLHGPRNVPAAMSLVEMMRGGAGVVGGGLTVHTVDMIELTEHVEASLVYRQGMDAVMVTDDKIVALREQIGAALDAYAEAVTGLSMKRTLAISSFEDMHEDICCGAQDTLAVLIVLPFHKSQVVDGTMDSGDAGFRMVNRNILERASCSVGILVDRGLGRPVNNSGMSVSDSSLNVSVVFTGGADDREALAYAGCIAKHPSVRLMVIRFLLDREAIRMAAGTGRRILTAITDEEKEMKVDSDYFAEFHEQHIQGKGVGYMEKHVMSGAEAVATLKAIEAGYQLFVVGRGGRETDSVLTSGMSERAECPELGPIGDVLASSEFSVTASVLVIQQHDHTKDSSNLISDEFMPL